MKGNVAADHVKLFLASFYVKCCHADYGLRAVDGNESKSKSFPRDVSLPQVTFWGGGGVLLVGNVEITVADRCVNMALPSECLEFYWDSHTTVPFHLLTA